MRIASRPAKVEFCPGHNPNRCTVCTPDLRTGPGVKATVPRAQVHRCWETAQLPARSHSHARQPPASALAHPDSRTTHHTAASPRASQESYCAPPGVAPPSPCPAPAVTGSPWPEPSAAPSVLRPRPAPPRAPPPSLPGGCELIPSSMFRPPPGSVLRRSRPAPRQRPAGCGVRGAPGPT